ncbi:hypothetical protein LINGRAHAP2_LOCUS4304 [Linum grandiflorum]
MGMVIVGFDACPMPFTLVTSIATWRCVRISLIILTFTGEAYTITCMHLQS